MLGENVESARAEILAIALALLDGLLCRECLEKFETITGHQQSAARAIQAVVSAADALEQA